MLWWNQILLRISRTLTPVPPRPIYAKWLALRANFNLKKFEKLSIQLEKQSIISIQSFFSVMVWKQPSNHFLALNVLSMSKFDFFGLIHKADFCLANVNLPVSKWFATYPVNFISSNTHDNIEMFGALFSPWFSMKQCSNDCNQILGWKHVREENQLPHIVK